MHPPEFEETVRVTKERLETVNIIPEGWLSKVEIKSILWEIVSREKAVNVDDSERGSLKHE